MLRVAICDDDQHHREEIYHIICKALFFRTDLEVENFENGIQVIEAIENKKFDFDLLLLDIHMAEMDGLRTAEYIRKNRIDVDIIFITVSKKYVYDGYTYKAFAYLIKPFDEKRIAYELNRYLDEKEQADDYLNIPIKGVVQRIALDKVIYFESVSRKILVHTKRETISFYAKMDELEEIVKGKQFVRCHQSYMVNRKYVSGITRNALIAEEASIPISRKYQKEIKDIWM